MKKRIIRNKHRKYGRAHFMADRYDVSRQTWWRWWTTGLMYAPHARTPCGDGLWDIERCDQRMEANAGGVAAS